MGHVRASAAKGQIICKAKRKVKSASQKFRKTATAWKRASGFSNRLWALHAKTANGEAGRAALYHLFCPLFNSPMCALKHRLHMPSLASRPAAKGCPAAHRFSISNKNRAPRHFCGASAGSVCLHGMPGIIPSLTAFFALGWPKSEGRSLRARDSLTPLAPAQPLRNNAHAPRPRATLPCLTASPSLHYRGTIARGRTA
jgi:hypothetical protein